LPPGATIDAEGCPFQVDRLCTARERRAPGLRVYFCDPKYAGVGEQLSAESISQLKALHDVTETPWEYRPLLYFLQEQDIGAAEENSRHNS